MHTIVIFDRIRENLSSSKKQVTKHLKMMVNRSITQTLTRSIYTSLTTFIMVAVLFILGVASIREFALPLMVGIVCGAYSSVCIIRSAVVCTENQGLKAKTNKFSASSKSQREEARSLCSAAGLLFLKQKGRNRCQWKNGWSAAKRADFAADCCKIRDRSR